MAGKLPPTYHRRHPLLVLYHNLLPMSTKKKLTQATHGLPSEQWQAVIADQLP